MALYHPFPEQVVADKPTTFFDYDQLARFFMVLPFLSKNKILILSKNPQKNDKSESFEDLFNNSGIASKLLSGPLDDIIEKEINLLLQKVRVEKGKSGNQEPQESETDFFDGLDITKVSEKELIKMSGPNKALIFSNRLDDTTKSDASLFIEREVRKRVFRKFPRKF